MNNKKKLISDKTKKNIVYVILYAFMAWLIVSVIFFKTNPNYNFPILRAIIVFFASVLLTKYFLYMLVSPWHDVIHYSYRITHRKKIDAYQPLVSVMIPAWNEARGILNTIKTLLASDWPHLEIIVVNDGSTDNSDALIREFLKEHYAAGEPAIHIVYDYKENGGKGSALNRAIELSRGDILVSIDADCVVLPDTVRSFVTCFADPTVMAAVGNVKIGNTEKLVGVIQYLEYLFSFYFKKAESLLNTIYIIGGAAGAFRREVFEKIGNYNTKNITEDIDLSVRIQDAGMKIVYASQAIVYTEGASDVKGLAKQRFRWKHGRFKTFRDNEHLFFSVESHHNKVLTWLILPLAIFAEVQTFLEPFFIFFLYIYAVLTNDFSSFFSGVVVVATIFFVQMFFDDRKTKSFSFYVLAPIGWLMFYLTTFIEWNALFVSIKSHIMHIKPKWQRWKRQGLGESIIKNYEGTLTYQK